MHHTFSGGCYVGGLVCYGFRMERRLRWNIFGGCDRIDDVTIFLGVDRGGLGPAFIGHRSSGRLLLVWQVVRQRACLHLAPTHRAHGQMGYALGTKATMKAREQRVVGLPIKAQGTRDAQTRLGHVDEVPAVVGQIEDFEFHLLEACSLHVRGKILIQTEMSGWRWDTIPE